ncbi:MAG: sigma-54-dependent Fis family transcriptional regulator [Spirochaetales bacterium]|nr:sigma-54-dependent Fis family transcriptional regulator [Spirochaetales bacterium]
MWVNKDLNLRSHPLPLDSIHYIHIITMMNQGDRSILLIDDEETVLNYFTSVLKSDNITNILTCSTSDDAKKLIKKKTFSVITLDLIMPGVSGLNLLDYILQEVPGTPVIVITASHDIETAIDCMKCGAFDFLTKPVNVNRLLSCVHHALTEHDVKKENMRLKKVLLDDKITNTHAFEKIKTKNKGMLLLFRYIDAIASTSLHILITGETGVGKELFSQAIHNASGRTGNFVPVNIAGLDDTMFSDTLFGHTKGAFTGAENTRRGMIAKAETGTLFLDEIGDLTPESQVKLLRLIQEREYYPLGSDTAIRTNARFVFATNRDLGHLVDSGLYRKDLYYRLSSHHLRIPPLRERKDDLNLLINLFWNKAIAEFEGESFPVPVEVFTLLHEYDFPGNIRELEGLIIESFIYYQKQGELSLFLEQKLGSAFTMTATSAQIQHNTNNLFSSCLLLPSIKEAIDLLVEEALKRSTGNQGKAAEILGITRTALNKRLHRSGK